MKNRRKIIAACTGCSSSSNMTTYTMSDWSDCMDISSDPAEFLTCKHIEAAASILSTKILPTLSSYRFLSRYRTMVAKALVDVLIEPSVPFIPNSWVEPHLINHITDKGKLGVFYTYIGSFVIIAHALTRTTKRRYHHCFECPRSYGCTHVSSITDDEPFEFEDELEAEVGRAPFFTESITEPTY
jgi:hypothetical protein